MKIECCIESIAEAKAAQQFGADRIELCAALDVGGLTPSKGLIKACVDLGGPEVHVMIRPRVGNFVYSSEEVDIMRKDVELAGNLGAQGVVFGFLQEDNKIDSYNTLSLTNLARQMNLEVTFHRAFDQVRNMHESLSLLVDSGVNRILTSGHAANVNEGKENLKMMVEESGGQIQIMAGGGVNAGNIEQLKSIGVDALHFSIRKIKEEGLPGMGNTYEVDEEKLNTLFELINRKND